MSLLPLAAELCGHSFSASSLPSGGLIADRGERDVHLLLPGGPVAARVLAVHYRINDPDFGENLAARLAVVGLAVRGSQTIGRRSPPRLERAYSAVQPPSIGKLGTSSLRTRQAGEAI
jgi:hypothetical protein